MVREEEKEEEARWWKSKLIRRRGSVGDWDEGEGVVGRRRGI